MSVVTEYTVTHIRFDEQIVAGKRLGRHGLVDSRSAGYPLTIERRLELRDIEHVRHGSLLDQGELGDCTGEMITGACATSPIFDALSMSHPDLDDALGRALYSDATALDGYPGSWPPTDTGSDGTSACKAARNRGLISGWLNASSVADVLQALMLGAVGLGFSWYDSMDRPASDGLITISSNAVVRGAHETVWRKIDVDRQRIGGDNSWGTSWGDHGMMWLSWADLDRLLHEGGDCVVPQALSVAPPVPIPPPPAPPLPDPTGDPVLDAYLADQRLGNFAAKHHGGEIAYAARAYARLRAHFGGV